MVPKTLLGSRYQSSPLALARLAVVLSVGAVYGRPNPAPLHSPPAAADDSGGYGYSYGYYGGYYGSYGSQGLGSAQPPPVQGPQQPPPPPINATATNCKVCFWIEFVLPRRFPDETSVKKLGCPAFASGLNTLIDRDHPQYSRLLDLSCWDSWPGSPSYKLYLYQVCSLAGDDVDGAAALFADFHGPGKPSWAKALSGLVDEAGKAVPGLQLGPLRTFQLEYSCKRPPVRRLSNPAVTFTKEMEPGWEEGLDPGAYVPPPREAMPPEWYAPPGFR